MIVFLVVLMSFSSFMLGAHALSQTETYKTGEEVRVKLEECQKELPRSKNCKIIAVVEEE